MANKKQLEADKAILTKRLAKNSSIFLTSADSAARIKAQKQSQSDLIALENINKQLAGLTAGNVKPEETVKEAIKKIEAKRFAENVPQLSDDVIADLLAGGVDLTNKGSFAAGGVGTTALVYFGETSKPGGLKFKGGVPVSTVTPETGFKNTVITDFWTDEALQNRIIGAYAAKGQSIGQVEAYGIWSQLVNTAAEIYQGGKGAKVTPMQLLADTLKSVKGDEPTLPTRSISQLDKAQTFAAMDEWASASTSIMRTLEDDEKEELLKILEKLNQGTVTTYKKVKNKKGQMENVQTTTPGLTSEKAQATVEQRLRELNPDDADRADRIRFADWLSGNVAGA
jgi:phage-related protein